MGAQNVHFEVFVKRHVKDAWAMAEARDSRDEALKLAAALLAGLPKGSVRVTKEAFDAELRVFRSVCIHEAGAERFIDEEKTGDGSLPCLTPEDLGNPAARETIQRVLAEWLERKQAIPLELLHRPDLAEDLEGSGAELQHAVQKVAVASTQKGDSTVHAYVRQLSELVQKALDRAYEDGKKGRIPPFPKTAQFSAVAGPILSAKGRREKLRAAMAARLGEEHGYAGKLAALLGFTDDLPAEAEARAFALEEIDAFIAEILAFEAGVRALAGPCADPGEEAERLTNVFDGSAQAACLAAAPLARKMAALVADGRAPHARTAIAHRLMEELRKPRRLRPSSVQGEVKLCRALAQKLVMAGGADLAPETLQAVFAQRSARLLHPEAVTEFLDGAATPDEELHRLLALEENLVGAQNKKKLAAYVRAAATAHKTESWFVRGPGKALERLARLGALQKRASRGHFPPEDAADLMRAFDALGVKLLSASRILEALANGPQPALDRAAALLRLAAGGALPHGECADDARRRALALVRGETGQAEARAPEARARLEEIQALMAGLTPAAATPATEPEPPAEIEPGAAA
ncbi:MAG: hypothetical protein KIS81_11575 [Maricaulaceae bacterium]|nr:hypothetical protein [Maricaulaceae bacterium]